VSVKTKKIVPGRERAPHRAKAASVAGVLDRFHCKSLRYRFIVPMESFKMRAFTKETGLKIGDEWNAGLCTEDPTKGYHAHFDGSASREIVEIRIAYYRGAIERRPIHAPPSTETIMAFVGSFIRDPQYRAIVYATLEDDDREWVSRFNLPFKVTMVGQEVVIDGVSLALPKNRFGARNGWVTKIGTNVVASVDLLRIVNFSSFDIEKELAVVNESIKIFVEQTT
jgi:hypothetical protein